MSKQPNPLLDLAAAAAILGGLTYLLKDSENNMDEAISQVADKAKAEFERAFSDCKDSLSQEDQMEWWKNKDFWIKTLSGECCSTTELMGKKETDGSWTYALVQYAHGKVSLKCQFNQGTVIDN